MTEIEHNLINDGVGWQNNLNDNINEDDDWEGGNNSAKLFERSRIKALAGKTFLTYLKWKTK